jgi:hypothetical protein
MLIAPDSIPVLVGVLPRARHLGSSHDGASPDIPRAIASPSPKLAKLPLCVNTDPFQIQVQRTFDRRTGEPNGSLSGSARFTMLLTD